MYTPVEQAVKTLLFYEQADLYAGAFGAFREGGSFVANLRCFMFPSRWICSKPSISPRQHGFKSIAILPHWLVTPRDAGRDNKMKLKQESLDVGGTTFSACFHGVDLGLSITQIFLSVQQPSFIQRRNSYSKFWLCMCVTCLTCYHKIISQWKATGSVT